MARLEIEEPCRGDRLLADPYAPVAADINDINRAARAYLHYLSDVSGTGFAMGRLLSPRKRIGGTGAWTSMNKIRAIANATWTAPVGSPVARRTVLPFVSQVMTATDGCAQVPQAASVV